MILLAGGLGFIGSNVSIELLKKGYEILIADNLSNSDIKVIDTLKSLCDTNEKLHFIEIDLTKYDDVRRMFSSYQIDSVICLAGKKSVNESISIPNDYYSTNINIHLNLSSCAELFNIKSYIFSSSATVYGTNESPINEESQIGHNITNPYGYSKYFIELMIQDLAKVSKIKFIILRYFNPVGSDISNKLGENPKNTPNNLMPVILSKIKANASLNIFGNDYDTKDGTCIRDFIHVYDLAIGHIKALEYADHMTKNIDVFNLGSGVGYTVLEMIMCFMRINAINLKYIISDKRLGDVPICFADISKAKQILNYNPVKTLEDMCRDSYLFYKHKLLN